MANDMNDLWFAEMINALDQIDGIVPIFDRRRNLRFIKIPGRIPIHLWLKKTDRGYHTTNFPTKHAQGLEAGQSEMFPSAVILTLGYLLKIDASGIARISITPPCGRKQKPEWAIDLALRSVTRAGMSVVGDSSVEVKITRFRQRRFAT